MVDFDKIEESNLQRQILFSTDEVGQLKTEAAKKRILGLNPHVKVNLYNESLTSENAMWIIKDYDVVIDGTDNFPTRYLVNDACVLLNKPNVYGSIFRFDGQSTVFNYQNGPCYRCLYPEPPPPGLVPSCAEGGVLGVLPGVIGGIQATEGLKILLGKETLSGRLLIYNALTMKFTELRLRKDKNCPICGENRTITKLIDYKQFCGIPETSQLSEDEMDVKRLKEMIDNKSDFVLVDCREQTEWELGNLEKLGARLIPLSQIREGNIGELENLSRDKDIVIHCRSGRRSLEALDILKSKGYKHLKSVAGGIKAWSEEIDDSIVV